MCSCSCAPGACRTYFHKLLTICYAWHKHKSQRGYEQRASELRASDMSKIMTQRIIAIKREKSARKRTSRRACYVLCALWLLQGCGERVQRWRLLRASFYYPSYDTKSVRLSVPSPVQDKAATTVCISCDALLFVK